MLDYIKLEYSKTALALIEKLEPRQRDQARIRLIKVYILEYSKTALAIVDH